MKNKLITVYIYLTENISYKLSTALVTLRFNIIRDIRDNPQ